MAYVLLRFLPSIVSAATIAFKIASSTAEQQLCKKGSICSSESISTVTVSLLNAPGLAVEKARKISPEPFWHPEPRLPMPRGTLLHILESCHGIIGASVATITIIDPSPAFGASPGSSCSKASYFLSKGIPLILNSLSGPMVCLYQKLLQYIPCLEYL